MKTQKTAKSGISKFFKIEYLIIILLIVLALLFFFSNNKLLNSTNIDSVNNTSYENVLEKRVENLLKNVSGLGNCDVLITVEGEGDKDVLKNTTVKVENGIKTTTETVVMVSGKPYVIKEYTPKVKGVIVVCSGADNLEVKIAITEVITTTLNVSSENIRILKMK